MKKSRLFAILAGMAVLSFSLFNSCEIGLGESVDTEAPSLSINNPPTSAVVRDAFTISGNWSDDGSVDGISISLKNTETKQTFSFSGSTGNGTWSCLIDPKKAGSEIKDGKYEATVTISDNGGHKTSSSRAFVIDNTPPVVVLQRPASSKAETDSNKIESYGQYLTIEGQAADDNDIEKLVIKFYSKEAPDTLICQKEITSVPPTISLDVAKFLDKDVYSKIYGDEKDKGEKSYYCEIIAYDGAKRYPAEGYEKADDAEGNAEPSYILWSTWEKFQTEYQKATNSSSKIKIPDLYSLKAGKTTTTASRSAAAESLVTNLFATAISSGSFKLNPLNNPTFSISGLELDVANDVENERSLTVQLSKGLDGLSLDTENMKVYLIPITTDANGKEVRGKKIYPQKSDYQQKGDGQFLTTIQKDNCKDENGNTVSLEYGKSYVIAVEGTDSENNKIVPSFDGKEFFIRFKAKNVAPGLTITEPSPTTSYLKKGDKLLIKGSTSVPDGYPTISVVCKKGDETTGRTIYTHKVTEADKEKIEAGLIIYNFEYEVPVDGTNFKFDQANSDQYVFDITSDMDNMPTTRTKTVIYDIDGPTISIDSMLPTAEKYKGTEDGATEPGEYLNGNVTMKVAIIDDYDTVNTEIKDPANDKRPYFIIEDANTHQQLSFKVGTETVPTVKHYITTPTKQSFVIHTEDIASGTVSRKIKVKIFAQDRAGNLGVDIEDKTNTAFEREYTVDQATDIPVILPSNHNSLSLNFATKDALIAQMQDSSITVKKSILTAGSPLQIKLIDDDGIASSVFKISEKDTGDNMTVPQGYNQTYTNTPSQTVLEYTLPIISGKYKCYVSVTDTIGNTKEKTFWIVATGAAPVVTISRTTPDNKIITTNASENAKTTIKNEISIDSGYDKFTVTRQESGCTPVVLYGENGSLGSILNELTFTDTFTPSAGRTANKVVYTVTDENSHDGTREFTYNIDNTKPVVLDTAQYPIGVPSTQQTQSASFRFTATAQDNAADSEVSSGIVKLQYTFDSAKATNHIVDVTGVSSLSETIVFNDESLEYAFDSEGKKKIYIRAIDDVGNIGDWVEKEFMYDTADPELKVVSYKRGSEAAVNFDANAASLSFDTGSEFILSGSAKDNNGIETFEIWQKKSGSTYTSGTNTDEQLGKKLTDISISNIDLTTGSWTVTGLPRNESAITSTAVESGVYTYTIRATDKSAYGTQSAKTTKQTVTVSIDKTPPTVTIDLAENNTQAYGENSLKGSAYTFRGTANDTGAGSSGFDTLWYAFTTSSTSPTSYSLKVKPSTSSWSIPMNLGTGKSGSDAAHTDTDDTLYEGKKYLWVKGVDKAGNESVVMHVDFMVDQKAPEVDTCDVYKNSDSAATAADSDGIVYLNKATGATKYTLKGTFIDANGISSVTVDGEAPDEFTNGSWEKTFTDQGKNVHTIIAYDDSGKTGVSGKSTTKTVSVTFDTSDPVVIIADLDSSSTAKTYWVSANGETTNLSTYINGTASDTGSDLKSLTIKVDGVEGTIPRTSSSWSYKYLIPNIFTENDDSSCHTVEVVAEDYAKNTTTKTAYFRYDKEAPKASLTLNKNGKYIKSSDLADVVISGYAHDGRTTGREVKEAKIAVTQDRNEISAYEMDVMTSTYGYVSTAGNTFGNFSKTGLDELQYTDGEYEFTLKVLDKAGNPPREGNPTAKLTVDTTPPEIVTNSLTLSDWNEAHSRAQINVQFKDKNPDTVYYYVNDYSKDGITQPSDVTNNNDWTVMTWEEAAQDTYKAYKTNSFSDGNGTVYIKIVDKAGNVTYGSSSALNYEVDTKAPELCTLGTVTVNNTELSGSSKLINGNNDVVFTVTAKDNNENRNSPGAAIKGDDATRIASVKLTKIGTTTYTETDIVSGTATLSNGTTGTKTGEWTITIPASKFTGKTSGSFPVTVTVADTNGNSKAFQLFTLDIDKVKPEIKNYALDSSYNKGLVNGKQTFYMTNINNSFMLTGIASDNREVATVTLTLTGTKNGSAYTKTMTSDNPSWTFEIDKDSGTDAWKNWSGTVNASLSVVDKAANVVEAPSTFDIIFDTSEPEASFDTSNWSGNWISGTGKVYINGSANDVSSIKSIKMKLDGGTETTVPVADPWTYELNCEGITENDNTTSSKHTLTLEVTDGCGNVKTLTQDFKLDKTTPVIKDLSVKNATTGAYTKSITDVKASGYAYDGVQNKYRPVTLTITAANSSGTEVDIGGTNKEITVTTGSTHNTTFGSFSDVPVSTKTLTDGEYVFTVKATDYAGNEAQEQVTITVDNTPPVVNSQSLGSWNTTGSAATITANFTEANPDSAYYYIDDRSTPSRTQENVPEADWVSMNINGTTATKSCTFSDGKGKVYIKVVDKAGNVGYATALDYEVDTKAPDVCTLGTVDGVTLSGSKLINGNNDVVFTVNATDYNDNRNSSGAVIGADPTRVSSVKLTKIGTTTYTDSNIVSGTATLSGGTTGTKNGEWTITIPASKFEGKTTGSFPVTVTVTDTTVNGKTRSKDYQLFTLDIDQVKPTLKSYALSSSYDAGVVGPEGSKVQTFYMNNTRDPFTLTGVAKDDREIEEVKLTIKNPSGTTLKILTSSDSAWTFTSENTAAEGETSNAWTTTWAGWTNYVTAELSVKDKAQNIVASPKTFKIIFDTTAPAALHKNDTSGKDIYFRVGDQDNDDITSSDSLWNNNLDKDIGGKYTSGTFGNKETIKIRGNFEETGSGLAMIYYQLYTTAPTTAQINSFVADPAGKADGYFAPKPASETTRRVFYNGTISGITADGTAGGKNYITLASTYLTTLSSFKAGHNYLVLVAVDNVGNAAVDNISGNYYTINVDTQAPQTATFADKYIDGKSNLTLALDVTDNPSGTGVVSAGIKSVTVKMDGVTEAKTATKNESTDKYEATIPVAQIPVSGTYNVSVTAIDGAGNPDTRNVGKVIVDKTPPTVTLTSTSGFVKAAIANASISVSDTNGLKKDASGKQIVTYNVYDSTDVNTDGTLKTNATSKANGTVEVGSESVAKVTSISTTNTTTFQDGKSYIVRFTAEDIVGNKTYVNTGAYTIDRTGPAITDDVSGVGGVKKETAVGATDKWFNAETLNIFGKFTDAGCGVESINYTITPADSAAINDSWSTADGTYSANLAGFKNGTNTLALIAVDKLGNQSGTKSYTVKVDTSQPEISEVNTNDFKQITLSNGTRAKTFYFDVSDTGSGIATAASSVTAKVGSKTITSGSNGSSISVAAPSNGKNRVTVTIGAEDLTTLAGNNSVIVTVTDQAGNQSNSQSIGTINMDKDDPVPSFTSHQAGATVNKTITLAGRITDTSNSAIKSIALTATSGSTTKTYGYPTGANGNITYANGQWSLTLNTIDFNNTTSAQDFTLSLTATDEADNVSDSNAATTNENEPVTLSLSIDQNSDRPVVKFTNLVKDGDKYILKYGNKAALEGTITDDDATSAKVVKTFIASSSPISSATATPSGTTSFNPATGDYTFTPASPADGAKTVYFYIVDNNDNVFYTTQTTQLTRPYKQYKTDDKEDNAAAITYNSDSNAPLINSVQLQAYTAATANMETQVINGENQQVDTTKNGVLTSLGTNCVVGGTSKNYVDLKVSAKDANGVKGIVIKVQQGTTTTYYRSNNTVSEPGVTGDENDENDDGYANTGTVEATTNDTSNHVYTTSRINITNYVNGQVTVTVKVYDNSGLYNNQESVFVIDRDAPTLSIDNNVAEGQVVFGINKITIGGSVTATDVDKIYYAVTNDTTESSAVTNWTEVEGQRISAQVIFGGSQADAEYGLPSYTLRKWMQTVYNYDDAYMTEHDENKPLKIHFKAVDTCGNAGYSSRTVSVVPNGDKPVITLSYPVNKAVNTPPSLAGTIRIYGNAEVVPGSGSVAAVYVQIDTAFNGTFNATGWETGFNNCKEGKNTSYTVEQIGNTTMRGIKAVGTDNWNLPINSDKEFNPAGGGTGDTRRMAIRIYGVGGSGKVSEPVIQEFTIDPNAPHIGGTGTDTGVMQLKLVQFDSTNPLTAAMTYDEAQAAISNQMPYVPGQTVWVKGQWYIAASVYDDAGINTIKLDENITGENPIYLVQGDSGEDGTIQSNLKIHTTQSVKDIFVKENDCSAAIENVSGKNNFDIYIPLPTSSGSGSLAFTLEAKEATSDGNSSKETVRVNFDNTPPKLGTTGHDNYNANAYNVQQDNGFYRLFGYATDAEGGNLVSDMKAVAFYFVRRGTAATNPVTKVYDPMWKDKSVAIQTGTTNTEGISYEYGMFWNTKTVGRSSTDLSVLTLTTKDDNIHAGGFVLMGGTIYTIRSVSADGTTITLKTDAPAGITEAKFAYAMVIDNFNMTESVDTRQKETDSSKYGYGYYKADATADDGDLMQEKWASGKWEAWINSANIPDGPIEIHYVAIDNAQNFSTGIVGNLSLTEYQKKTTLDVTANGTPGTAANNLISGFDYIYDANKKAYVSNNAPRIAGIIVGTDYNGNGTIEASEKQPKYVELGTRVFSSVPNTSTITKVLQQFNASSDGTASGLPFMRVVDDTSVEIEIIGGNNEMYYRYHITENCDDTATFTNGTYGTGKTSWQITRTPGEGYKTDDDGHQGYYTTTTLPAINFTTDQLKDAIRVDEDDEGENGTRWWTIQVWDSTEETTHFENSQYAELKLPLDIEVLDGISPNTVINDLYWNSATDNSVYRDSNGKLHGHVELKKDLTYKEGNTTKTTNLGTTYGVDDDKISGKVVFRGYAYDNKRLGNLRWGIRSTPYSTTNWTAGTVYAVNDVVYYADNTSKNYYKCKTAHTAGETFNTSNWDVYRTYEAWPQTYITAATYSSGTWTPTGSETIDTPFYYLKVYTDADHGAYLDERGHKVYWELTIDTSRVQIPGQEAQDALGVGKNLYVYMQATDAAGKVTEMNPDSSAIITDGTDEENLRPNYKVDVVPYITGVKTRLSRKNKSNPEVYSRTAQGHYPIASDETKSGSVVLQGFNLSTGNADVDISSIISTQTTGAYVYTRGTGANAVMSINNMNFNDAHGDYNLSDTTLNEKTKVQNMYNRTPSTVTNLTLDDDVYFDIWEFKKAAAPKSGKINEPVMRINPTNQSIGFAFANGADSLSLPSARTQNNTYNFTSYTNWQYNYADYAGINFVYDTAGTVHSISTGLDTEPKSGLAGYMQYINSGWGGNGNNMNNWNAERTLALESVGIPSGVYVGGKALTANLIDVDRFGKPTIAVAGTSRVYVAYYDGDNDQIRFRYGDNITKSRRTGGRSSGYEQFSDDKTAGGTIGHDTAGDGYNSHTMFEAHTDYYSLLAGKTQGATQTDTGNGTSEFVALDVIAGNSAANDIVVIVWYDGSDLMYTYREGEKDDKDCSSDGVTGKWSKPEVIFEGAGQYCTIKVDKNNGIHIAAYNRSGADLYYAYMPGYDQYAKLKTALVDSYSQVGKFISLDTALVLREGTTDKYNVVPYITYYGDGFNGLPKLAYLPEGINKDDVVVPNGADDSTDLFTGEWEVSLIPTSSEVNEDNMNVALWKTNAGVLTASTKPATGYTEPKIIAAGTNSATWYGNGSSELVLGYGITDGATGFIEIGQMKNPEQ